MGPQGQIERSYLQLEGGRPQGQIERSLVEVSIAFQKEREKRHDALSSTHSGEYDQQVQVHFSGTATDTYGYADIPVTWEHPFVYAPSQRDPPFETPLVTSHVEFVTTSGVLVVAHAHVIDWNVDSRAWYIGAKVRVAVAAPGQENPVAFVGVLHLNFEGYASPTDEDVNQ